MTGLDALPTTDAHRKRLHPQGTASSGQTAESSSDVRVIEKRSPAADQPGIWASGSSLHTAKVPFTTRSVSC